MSKGAGEVLEQWFGVPAAPVMTREALIERLYEELTALALPWRHLWLSERPLPNGTLFDAAGRRVRFPDGWDRAWVALLDPEPGARWAHAANWVFLRPDGSGSAEACPTDLPWHLDTRDRFLCVEERQ